MFMPGEGREHHREEGIKFDYMLCVSIKETCMSGYGLNVEMFIWKLFRLENEVEILWVYNYYNED